MKLLMLRGIPGSGKTTHALELCASDDTWVRVNKDDLRLQLFDHPKGSKQRLSKEQEDAMLKVHANKIRYALASGKNVVVDDTNFGRNEARLRAIAQEYGAEFVILNFDTPVEECIRRDAERPEGESVGADVIRRFARENKIEQPAPVAQCAPATYQHEHGLPWVVICDLDGTAAHIGDRSPYDASKCDELDQPNEPVRAVLKALLHPGGPGTVSQVVYMSGREDKDRQATERFLAKHNFPKGAVHMRATGDRRKDSIVKGELFDAHVRGKYNVLFVLDDRNQVVEFWRSIGLSCFQVAEGNF